MKKHYPEQIEFICNRCNKREKAEPEFLEEFSAQKTLRIQHLPTTEEGARTLEKAQDDLLPHCCPKQDYGYDVHLCNECTEQYDIPIFEWIQSHRNKNRK